MARTTDKNLPATTKRQLPANWRAEMEKHVSQSVSQEASVATGVFITTRAGQLAYQGTPFKDNQLEAIIVDSMLENSYYEDKFDADNPASPVCYAIGRDDKTLAPHEKSAKPQSDLCRNCKWNEFDTADQGRGKACKNIRRMALLPADEKQRNPAAIDKNDFALLKIPVTSVKGWAAYVKTLAALEKLSPAGVVTRISARPDPKTQFKVIFEHVENVDDKLMPLVMSRVAEAGAALNTPYPDQPAESAAPKKAASKRRKF